MRRAWVVTCAGLLTVASSSCRSPIADRRSPNCPPAASPESRPPALAAPELGLVAPDVFIPIAERNGVIIELGRWVLQQACGQAAAWQHQYGQDAPGKVSVNVSARQLAEPGFVAEVHDVLRRAGVDRHRLMLEVTETAVLGADTAITAVQELRDLGLQVALDDFGTGNSSLSLLVDCPVDVLEVDKSFVVGVTLDGPRAMVVQSLITVANGMRIEAVAEGVETLEQADCLRAAGYRLVEGKHYARPMMGPTFLAHSRRLRRSAPNGTAEPNLVAPSLAPGRRSTGDLPQRPVANRRRETAVRAFDAHA